MSDSFKCPECGVVRTISEMELWQVYDHDSKETEIDCDNCDSGLLITSLVTGWKFEVEKVQDAIMSGERVMVCRECGSEFISITSSREMETTQISCTDCGDLNQYKVPEVDAIEIYKATSKGKQDA